MERVYYCPCAPLWRVLSLSRGEGGRFSQKSILGPFAGKLGSVGNADAVHCITRPLSALYMNGREERERMREEQGIIAPGKVGELSQAVIDALGLQMKPGQEILLGASNIAHMRTKHEADYYRYACALVDILAAPDYVGLNPKDGSIEYVKEFLLEGDYVKVAVRVSLSGNLYARSLYVLNRRRVHNFIESGALKKLLTKPEE